MAARRILLAGASGTIGYQALREAKARDMLVRTLSRTEERAGRIRALADDARVADATSAGSIAGICQGVDAVISALGNSVAMRSPDRRSYLAVDVLANANLIDEAKRAGVRRFIYVAAFFAPGYAESAYIRAHEKVVGLLADSGLDRCVIRPTGLFRSFLDFLEMARRGRAMMLGTGTARTNPIHEREVARACLEAIDSGAGELAIGGPEVLTRREIIEAAFRAVGRPPRITRLPVWMARAVAAALHPFNPRLSELLDFASRVFQSESIAPTCGTLKLAEYFREAAGLGDAAGAEKPIRG